MIEIPQRTGMVRKNAADIKLAVDAMEMVFTRDFITTFVIASGDSDFTPLVLKLRELNRRVIGVGVEGSTSELLPGACDEFLFYERLAGIGSGSVARRRRKPQEERSDEPDESPTDIAEVSRLTTQTLSGLQRSLDGPVLSSMIKRSILRKDPTFSEGDYGFRTWGELMRHLGDAGRRRTSAQRRAGRPRRGFPVERRGTRTRAFDVLRNDVVAELAEEERPATAVGAEERATQAPPRTSARRTSATGLPAVREGRRARRASSTSSGTTKPRTTYSRQPEPPNLVATAVVAVREYLERVSGARSGRSPC